jgi:hypothetical protein
MRCARSTRKGSRALVYITVQWDSESAKNHPEWLIRGRMGEHEGGPFTEPGFYQSLCVNTGIWIFSGTYPEVVSFWGRAGRAVFRHRGHPPLPVRGVPPGDEGAGR